MQYYIAYQTGRTSLHSPENENNCEKVFYYHKCWKTNDPVVSVFNVSSIENTLVLLLPALIFIAALFPYVNIVLNGWNWLLSTGWLCPLVLSSFQIVSSVLISCKTLCTINGKMMPLNLFELSLFFFFSPKTFLFWTKK